MCLCVGVCVCVYVYIDVGIGVCVCVCLHTHPKYQHEDIHNKSAQHLKFGTIDVKKQNLFVDRTKYENIIIM